MAGQGVGQAAVDADGVDDAFHRGPFSSTPSGPRGRPAVARDRRSTPCGTGTPLSNNRLKTTMPADAAPATEYLIECSITQEDAETIFEFTLPEQTVKVTVPEALNDEQCATVVQCFLETVKNR